MPLPLLLALLTAIAPLAIDMYLPAVAAMAIDLNSEIHQVELSVSTFLLGYAAGQLLGGPMSDRFGRKPVILLGLTLYFIASVSLVYISDLDSLLWWRAIQAVGGGLATVNSPAVVRDRYQGDDIARTLSMVAMIMMMAPLLAPALGAVIVTLGDWRDIFIVLAIYALFVIVVVATTLPESHPPERRVRQSPWQNYWQVLCHKPSQPYILALAFAFSTMFVFITAAPFLYLEYYQRPPSQFAWLFGANILVMMTLNRLNVWLLPRFGSHVLLQAGTALQLCATALLVLVTWLLPSPPLELVLPLIMFSVGSLGLIAANAFSIVLQHFRSISGSATALIGVTEFLIGALFGWCWTLLHDYSARPMMLMMLFSASLAFSLVWMANRRQHYPTCATN
ncbi:Bcr/CflA family drug resistance efflux transporter [Bacterioplanes sanyensis]|uniref:Bcr/CflA family efflux transporter n=1 Tax=Bacterioplanes sanyensis TaxID=1249553 RepID=A0A222FEL8_9GAMM|nr:Bcr/CflA family multidrug efflux MFS transporter [Bacterioplanes sanyensis]ASP37200.1 Bcr/CflA family drug resistance efflux transporter [Bacterioplanes sanyensis]